MAAAEKCTSMAEAIERGLNREYAIMIGKRAAASHGWPTKPADPFADEADGEPTDEERFRETLRKAGIRARFAECTLASYIPRTPAQTEALQTCRAYALGNCGSDQGLLLMGEPNGGKTHLLIGILRAWLERGKRCHYLTAEKFFVGLRSTFNERGNTERDYLDRLIGYDLLVIDDLHALTDGEGYQYRMLWHLLDERYCEKRPTLASTNKTLDEFKGLLDQRTRRRLQATLVMVDAPKK
jgi:DNA replication protein DnaC